MGWEPKSGPLPRGRWRHGRTPCGQRVKPKTHSTCLPPSQVMATAGHHGGSGCEPHNTQEEPDPTTHRLPISPATPAGPAMPRANLSTAQMGWKSLQKVQGMKRRETALTLDKQMSGMDSLSLDAVCTTGVGTSVLPTDRCHCQAAITHLGPRRDRAQHQPWGPTSTTPRCRWT